MQSCQVPIHNDIRKSFVSLSMKCLFVGSLRKKRKWVAHFLLIRIREKIILLEHLSSEKNDVIFHILDQIKVQGYRCKSGIAIFAWRIPWNYAYSFYKRLKALYT